MRIAVIGAGAIGGFFGALLTRAGQEVTFIARGDHLEVIRNSGVSLVSATVGDFVVHPTASGRADDIGPVDVVLMCV